MDFPLKHSGAIHCGAWRRAPIAQRLSDQCGEQRQHGDCNHDVTALVGIRSSALIGRFLIRPFPGHKQDDLCVSRSQSGLQ